MKALKFALFTAALGLSGLAHAQGPNPNEVSINSLSFAGSGCPAGTVAGNISSDAQAFTLLFDSYVAEAGPGLSLSAGRKACQLLADIHFPQGWQYSIFAVDTRGYLNLDPGVQATQQTTFYFQGQMNSGVSKTDFFGPLSQDYASRDVLGIASLVWSPCGVNRALNVKTSVSLRAPSGARGLATVDSVDGEFRMIYGFRWRRC